MYSKVFHVVSSFKFYDQNFVHISYFFQTSNKTAYFVAIIISNETYQ